MLQNIAKTCLVSAHLKQKKIFEHYQRNLRINDKEVQFIICGSIYASLINNIIQDSVVLFPFQHVILIIGASSP